MKTTIVIGAVILLSATTAYGAAKLAKSEDFAQVGIGSDSLIISKVKDGAVTCYVSRHTNAGSHSISCVK